MNKWEKLLDALAHIREGMDAIEDLYERETTVRALLLSRIPVLGVPGSFQTVNGALVDLTQRTMKLRDGAGHA